MYLLYKLLIFTVARVTKDSKEYISEYREEKFQCIILHAHRLFNNLSNVLAITYYIKYHMFPNRSYRLRILRLYLWRITVEIFLNYRLGAISTFSSDAKSLYYKNYIDVNITEYLIMAKILNFQIKLLCAAMQFIMPLPFSNSSYRCNVFSEPLVHALTNVLPARVVGIECICGYVAISFRKMYHVNQTFYPVTR